MAYTGFISIAGQFLNEVQEIGELTPAPSLGLSRSTSCLVPTVSFEAAAAAAVAAADMLNVEPTPATAGIDADAVADDRPVWECSTEWEVTDIEAAAAATAAEPAVEAPLITTPATVLACDPDTQCGCSSGSKLASTLADINSGRSAADVTKDVGQIPPSEPVATPRLPDYTPINNDGAASAPADRMAEAHTSIGLVESSENASITDAPKKIVAYPLEVGLFSAGDVSAKSLELAPTGAPTPVASPVSTAMGAISSADDGSDVFLSSEGGVSAVVGQVERPEVSTGDPRLNPGSTAGEPEEQHVCEVCGIITASEAHMQVPTQAPPHHLATL